jgi:hypothetical protein
MGQQTNLIVLPMQSGETQEYTFVADVDSVDSFSYALYKVTPSADNTYFTKTSADIQTPQSVSVTQSGSTGAFTFLARFAPSQLSTIDSEYYGIVILINAVDTATTRQREFDVVFQIRPFVQ